jgi:hypothetical protein
MAGACVRAVVGVGVCVGVCLRVRARRAALSNLMDIPTDCPQRERRGWLGDAQVAAETNIANFDMAAFYTKAREAGWVGASGCSRVGGARGPSGALLCLSPRDSVERARWLEAASCPACHPATVWRLPAFGGLLVTHRLPAELPVCDWEGTPMHPRGGALGRMSPCAHYSIPSCGCIPGVTLVSSVAARHPRHTAGAGGDQPRQRLPARLLAVVPPRRPARGSGCVHACKPRPPHCMTGVLQQSLHALGATTG